jgi:hypothetical protein
LFYGFFYLFVKNVIFMVLLAVEVSGRDVI